MNTRNLLLAAAFISVISAAIGGVLSYELFLHTTSRALKTQAVEIMDSKGNLRAQLATEGDGGVFLSFVTPKQEKELFLGINGPGSDYSGKSNLEPEIQLNDGSGRRAVSLLTTNHGEGLLSFDSKTHYGALRLGYFAVAEDYPSEKGPSYEWGVAIDNGYARTGIGVIEGPGDSKKYMTIPPDLSKRPPHTP